MDRRINNLRDGCLGTMIENLYAGKLMFDIHPRIAYNLADQDFSRVLTFHQDFKRKDLMKEGNRPYSITYRIAYALSNTHHSDLFLRKEYIEIPRIFKEFAKVMTPDPIRIPRIGGVDIIIKDHPLLDRTLNSRTEFSSRMSLSEDRIICYKGKEKELLKALTPQQIQVDNVKLRCLEGWKEIQVIFDITKKENYFPCDDLYHLQQPVVGKYEGMLEIAGHEIIVAGVAGRESGSMTLGLSFLEDHKPWGRKGNGMEFSLDAYIDSGSGICTAKPGVFPKEARETLPVIAGRDFLQKILILNKGIREAKIMIGGAFGSPWFRVKTPPIYFHDTGTDILLGNNFIQTFVRYMQDNQRNLLIFTTNCGNEIQVLRREKAFNRIMPINFRSKRGDMDAKLTHPKMQDKRKFGKVLLSFRQQGLIDSDSFYKESEEEILNLKEALLEMKSLDISEDSRLSLENVKRLIQRNFSENPLAWWDRNKIEATLKVKDECKYEYVRYKPIQMNMEDKKDMQMIIKEHISLGLIEPGISTYSSPGFLVRNHGEIKRGKPRLVINYQGINKILEFDGYYIPSREHLIDCIKRAKVFSKFDCKSGFYQIKMENESKKITAFSTPQGQYIWNDHIVEKIRNFPDVLKDKKQLQSFLGVINFAGIFIKDLVRYRKNFRPLLKETESTKWKWEEIHTKRVHELKQVCSNLPKLAIPQDGDELVVYTDANDYRWATVLLKKTTTGEEPCRYTGGLFSEQQAKVWHINEKEFFAAPLENLEELDRKFGQLAVNAQVAGQIQRADLDKVQVAIRSSLLASTSLWNDLRESIRKASPSGMTHELREHDPKHAFRVQGSTPVASDSSTDCTRPSPDSGETAQLNHRKCKLLKVQVNPTPLGDYQRMWEKLISHKRVNPGKTIIETFEKYNRVWMLEGSKPEDVREWYDFGALASIHTMSLSFPEISKLPEWISGAVFDSWQNNPHLKRGDVLEIKFISLAPETAGKGSHPAFHFMKLQRPDMVAFNKIKAASLGICH
ncbi:UNVERIFIED_CONTAM: Enzymatic polyprotein [Sesamum indicum]